MTELEGVDVTALEAGCERLGVAELGLRVGLHPGWAINDPSAELAQVLGRPVDLVAQRTPHHRLWDTVLSGAKVDCAA